MVRSFVNLRFFEEGATLRGHFQTGVSLHSHTLYSRESLSLTCRVAGATPLIAAAVRRCEKWYRRRHGSAPDLTRGWWTPPLGPHESWLLEKAQIEHLGLGALVSLSDHDDIEGPVSLQVLRECRELPVSFEWTVPFGTAFFHLGVHNLPLKTARRMFAEMEEFTRQPAPGRLAELLDALSEKAETLVVFNHPFWDEGQIGQEMHDRSANEFIRLHRANLHALEFNGLRPWRENRAALALAEAVDLPVVSGGDRHGLEPAASLNVTHAASFAEFAGEVRAGRSEVLVMPHYHQPHALRVARGVVEVLQTYERHANGWKLWSDRVFYQCDDGQVRSLTETFGPRPPAAVSFILGLVRFVSSSRVRRFLRGASSTGEGVAL